ncbi:MAG: hypothetical protein IEMM0006_2214 [bacterium]|nr:MAG: hypothetical protein IEMM0006_2214 [bacterium]
MGNRKIQIGIAFLFLGTLLWIGGCTHKPGVYYNNTPEVSANYSADTVYFQNDILPLLNSTCDLSSCHDATTGKEGVVLTDYAAVMKTGGINLQNPAESGIYRVLSKSGEDRMPPAPAQAWSSNQTASLLKWISQGALNNAYVDTTCDTTRVTFVGNVAPILQKYCDGCHNSSNPLGGIDLTNPSQLALLSGNGSLLGAIRQKSGYIPMPLGGNKLSNCDIETIAIWIRDTTPSVGGSQQWKTPGRHSP